MKIIAIAADNSLPLAFRGFPKAVSGIDWKCSDRHSPAGGGFWNGSCVSGDQAGVDGCSLRGAVRGARSLAAKFTPRHHCARVVRHCHPLTAHLELM